MQHSTASRFSMFIYSNTKWANVKCIELKSHDSIKLTGFQVANQMKSKKQKKFKIKKSHQNQWLEFDILESEK